MEEEEEEEEEGRVRRDWFCNFKTRRRGKDLVVSVVHRLPPVADNVQSSDDLTDGEETNDLSGSDADESEFLGGGVTDAGQEVLGREAAARRVAGDGEEVLVVRLEGGQVAVMRVSELLCLETDC